MVVNEYTFDVKWSATDAAGIVFYPNFYKWMDDATSNFFSSIGVPVSRLYAEEKLAVPLLEAKCQFKSPLRFEDQVTIQSSVREIRNKVLVFNHIFIRDGIEVAKGYEIRAWTRFKDQPKAEPVPEYVRNAFGQPQPSV